MNILFCAAEATPFSKAGGLADVAGALPKALVAAGHDCTVITPYYRTVKKGSYPSESTGISGSMLVGDRLISYDLLEWHDDTPGAPRFLFLRADDFFDREGIYTDDSGEGYSDNNKRYIYYQMVIADLLRNGLLKCDVLHCNDHHTALLPVLLSSLKKPIPTLLTVHSFIYQGQFSLDEAELLPADVQDLLTLESKGDHYNALKEGVRQASHVNTVSPGYADELLDGLWIEPSFAGILRERGDAFNGILNGIDTPYWNPATDPYLSNHYNAEALDGKSVIKQALQEKCGLAQRTDAPLFGSISRLVENKGFNLIIEVVPEFVEIGVQFVFLGSGDRKIRDALNDLARRFPQQVSFNEGYNEPLAHEIEAGADMFLMPSQIEPCGLNQMYSLRYGTIPIVYRTGGLIDTVEDWDGSNGTGFLFTDYDDEALAKAMVRAIDLFVEPESWKKIVVQAMQQDNSWARIAREYVAIYTKITGGSDAD